MWFVVSGELHTRPAAIGTCQLCVRLVVEGDGYTQSSGEAPRHLSCVDAAYRSGARFGYQETKRMLRAATKAMRGAG